MHAVAQGCSGLTKKIKTLFTWIIGQKRQRFVTVEN